MPTAMTILVSLFAGALLVLVLFILALRQRNMQSWLGAYHFPQEPRPKLPALSGSGSHDTIDVYLAVCDHYEPEWNRPAKEVSLAKVQRWVKAYPRLYGRFRDVDGRPPQHTFFFPQDEYRPEYLDELAKLCIAGYGDVDVHLHHDEDTAEMLREKLVSFRDDLSQRHGLLRKDPRTGQIVYGFIHGNWALCNSRKDRRWCGVDQELTVLLETGCYADFTMPSAPSETQSSTINSIYYAKDIPGRTSSHSVVAQRARVGLAAPQDHLLMIQGPLAPDWGHRKFGLIPRIENADITLGRPATLRRFLKWLECGVHVSGQPNCRFVKLHTHGCKDGNIDEWLGGEGMLAFHADLATFARTHPSIRYHYVSAWEMAQRVHQLEQS